jgi:hypothetical protein
MVLLRMHQEFAALHARSALISGRTANQAFFSGPCGKSVFHVYRFLWFLCFFRGMELMLSSEPEGGSLAMVR